MTPGRLDFQIWRGITFDPIIFNCKDGSGNPVNLTNWQVSAKARNGNGKLINLGPTITDAPNGKVTISLSGATTAAFMAGQQSWDMTFQRPTGEKLGPYIFGTITVKDTIANA